MQERLCLLLYALGAYEYVYAFLWRWIVLCKIWHDIGCRHALCHKQQLDHWKFCKNRKSKTVGPLVSTRRTERNMPKYGFVQKESGGNEKYNVNTKASTWRPALERMPKMLIYRFSCVYTNEYYNVLLFFFVYAISRLVHFLSLYVEKVIKQCVQNCMFPWVFGWQGGVGVHSTYTHQYRKELPVSTRHRQDQSDKVLQRL